jgi:hypothetical protein
MPTSRHLHNGGLTLAAGLAVLLASAPATNGCKGGDLAGDDDSNGSAGADGGDAGNAGPAGACVDTPVERRVWSLSRNEYDHTVAAILGDTAGLAATTFPPEARTNGFSINPQAQVVDSSLVGLMMTAAETIAAASLSNELAYIKSTLSCTLAASPTAGSPDPCATSYIKNRGAALARRPLTDEEATDLYASYLTGVQNPYDGTAATSSGIELVVATLLQGPQFFYRTELGDPKDTTSSPIDLTQYEIASAISYLATGGPPDAALLAAADGGTLNGDAIGTQYQRLLDTAAGHTQTESFVLEWLAEDGIGKAGGSDGPVTPAIAQAMQAEAQGFIEEAVFKGAGTVQELLTGSYTFVNAELATYYGLPASGLAATATKQPLDPSSGRAGLLSQGAFLIGASAPGIPLLHRGHVIRDKVLCEALPSTASLGLPNFVPPNLPPPADGTTTRQPLTETIGTGSVCSTCHQFFQPLGYALENFDPFGRFQATQNGGKVDPSGQLLESTSIDPDTGAIRDPKSFTKVDFADYPGFAKALAASPRVESCFASQLVSFASGRLTPVNACATAGVQISPSGSGPASIPQQLANYVKSKAFVSRTR